MSGMVLVIDSDVDSAELMVRGLLDAGYDAVVKGSVMQGLVAARESRPALVITESSLPDGDGLDVVTRLAAVGIPVMVVTGMGDVASKVALLDAGAADYVVKPFEVQELLARVTAKLRDRRVEGEWAGLVVGDLVLDVQRRLVLFRTKEVRLTERERDVLEALMHEPDRLFSYQELLQRVWGAGTPVTTASSNILAVNVSNIRRKLHAADASGYIRTARGIGYALNVPKSR